MGDGNGRKREMWGIWNISNRNRKGGLGSEVLEIYFF